MSELNFEFGHLDYSDDDLNSSIYKILDENFLCSIASINENKSHINTAYFCFNNSLEIYFASSPLTQHVKNIEKNTSVAVSIFDSRQSWDKNKKGLQIFGNCKNAEGAYSIEGTYLYLKRFAGLKQWFSRPDSFLKGAVNSKIFIIKPTNIKLFDEESFGKETAINLNI